MPPPDDVRLRHLVEAARKAIAFTEGRSRDDLANDELLRLAVTKLVEIVGEAAKLVSDETRQRHPAVPRRPHARPPCEKGSSRLSTDSDSLSSSSTLARNSLMAA